MDISLLDTVLRGALTIEFALMAVYGIVALAHTISLDVQIRRINIAHQNMIDGIYQARLELWEKEKLERIERIERMAAK